MNPSVESPHDAAIADGDARPTVIFLHIPKTGGLTLSDVMLRNYGRSRLEIMAGRGPESRDAHLRFLETGEPEPRALPGTNPAARFRQIHPRRRAKLRAVTGHFPFGLHEAIDRPSTYLTLVRDPIDRVLSGYHYRVVRHGFGLSLEEYIRSERDPAMHDAQVRRVAGIGPQRGERLGRGALDLAKRHVEERFSLVGVTERFDESLVLAAHLFDWRRIAYRRQNEGRGRPRKEDLPSGLLRILERNNQLDLEFFEFARDRLQQHLDATGIDLDQALARLRRRSSLYRRIAPPRARTGPNWKRHPVERTIPPAAQR